MRSPGLFVEPHFYDRLCSHRCVFLPKLIIIPGTLSPPNSMTSTTVSFNAYSRFNALLLPRLGCDELGCSWFWSFAACSRSAFRVQFPRARFSQLLTRFQQIPITCSLKPPPPPPVSATLSFISKRSPLPHRHPILLPLTKGHAFLTHTESLTISFVSSRGRQRAALAHGQTAFNHLFRGFNV